MKKQIKQLKKGDKFTFNYETFVVIRKWISEEKPLIAENIKCRVRERFYFEELEVSVNNENIEDTVGVVFSC